MFVITPGGELVGYSEWPWDRLYTPVVGCFSRGRLQTYAVCEEEPQRVGIRGPALRYWFRMKLEQALLDRLLDGDPTIRLARLEDGAPVPNAGKSEVGGETESRLARVEELLGAGETSRPRPLNGFSAFLTAPVRQQVDCVYLDIFGRPVDPGGYANYGIKVANGELSLIALRNLLLLSDEFMNRGVTMAEKVGALITSPMWRQLTSLETPGHRVRPLPAFKLADYEGLGTEGFIEVCYEHFLGRPSDTVGLGYYSQMAEQESRSVVAVELSREAAHRGIYLNVVSS